MRNDLPAKKWPDIFASGEKMEFLGKTWLRSEHNFKHGWIASYETSTQRWFFYYVQLLKKCQVLKNVHFCRKIRKKRLHVEIVPVVLPKPLVDNRKDPRKSGEVFRSQQLQKPHYRYTQKHNLLRSHLPSYFQQIFLSNILRYAHFEPYFLRCV